MANKGPRAQYDKGEQEWFKKRRVRNRARNKLQKASRKQNR